MSKTNIFRESKETLAEKLYDMLDDRGCFGDMFLKDEFVECFEKVLIDYSLVLKTGLID